MNGQLDSYVADGLQLLARHGREWNGTPNSLKGALREKHNRELNELRMQHGLSGDRFGLPYSGS